MSGGADGALAAAALIVGVVLVGMAGLFWWLYRPREAPGLGRYGALRASFRNYKAQITGAGFCTVKIHRLIEASRAALRRDGAEALSDPGRALDDPRFAHAVGRWRETPGDLSAVPWNPSTGKATAARMLARGVTEPGGWWAVVEAEGAVGVIAVSAETGLLVRARFTAPSAGETLSGF